MAVHPIPFRYTFGRAMPGRSEKSSDASAPIVDLSLLLVVLDPVVTLEEEMLLRRLASVRVVERPLRAAGFGRGW